MRYLEVPYKKGGEKHLLTITVDKSIYTELTLEVGNESEYKAYIPLPAGEISISSPTLSTQDFRITETRPEGEVHFAFHYAPSFGWVNDPNGLYYENGTYHMYYQFNPVSREWGNMSWGHAVSCDLTKWTEKDPVMLPLSRNEHIFSGSAIKEGAETAFYYTLCTFDDDRNNTQRRRYTRDGGYTFLDDEIVIPPAAKGARDPKAFYFKDREYIILYLDSNDFAIYIREESGWKQLSVFSAPDAWECPDLFFFPDGRCVFTSADGFYWTASFDGEKVTLLSERRNMFLTKLPYASQSFYGTEGRTVIVSWLRAKTPTLSSQGVMGLPREVELDEEGTIHLHPVREFMNALSYERKNTSTLSSTEKAYVIKLHDISSFEGRINGNHATYSKGKLTIGETSVDFSSSEVILIVDGLIAEISDGTYIQNAYFELESIEDGDTFLSLGTECSIDAAFIRK